MSGITRELPKTLYSAKQAKRIDQAWIRSHPVTGYQLMCRAGLGLWHLMQGSLTAGARIVILVGAGNNGGDGYVVARLAHEQGYSVLIVYSTPPRNLKGPAREAAQICESASIECQPWAGKLPPADVYVDALLGIGFSPVMGSANPLKPPINDMVAALNKVSVPIYSADIPTGIDADRGKLTNLAVKATATVTFITCSPGLLTGSAVDYVGELWFDDLGVPDEVLQSFASTINCLGRAQIPTQAALNRVRSRSLSAHKGDFGHVVIVGGDLGLGGAALMAAEAALMAGAGKVSLITRPEHVPAALVRVPEVMVLGVDVKSSEEVLRKANDVLMQASVAVLGVGLGLGEWGINLAQLTFEYSKALVLDADVLNLLADRSLSWPDANTPRVMTPHPKEAARLLNTTVPNVENDRLYAAEKCRDRFRAQVVLKGAGTVVSRYSGSHSQSTLIHAGNPGMASGGTGDVLSGVIGALVAQGLPVDLAAVNGSLLHAVAGDEAAERLGQVGLRASELPRYVRQLLAKPVGPMLPEALSSSTVTDTLSLAVKDVRNSQAVASSSSPSAASAFDA